MGSLMVMMGSSVFKSHTPTNKGLKPNRDELLKYWKDIQKPHSNK